MKKRKPKTNISVDVTKKMRKTPEILKIQTKQGGRTNISVDVAKKMRKTPEILKIQAEQGGRTNISVDVAKKKRKTWEILKKQSGTGGVGTSDAPHRREKQCSMRKLAKTYRNNETTHGTAGRGRRILYWKTCVSALKMKQKRGPKRILA